jgi:curved DNA-binding protein CbpA
MTLRSPVCREDDAGHAMATHYEVLGVKTTAEPDEIKRAWRQIARESHPDRRGGDASAVARFKRASEAYDVLSDPERRSTYDFGLRAAARLARAVRRAPPWESRRMYDVPRPNPEAGRGHRRYRPEQAGPSAHDLRPDAQSRHDESVAVLAPAVAFVGLGPIALTFGAAAPYLGLLAFPLMAWLWWTLERRDPYRLPLMGLAMVVAFGAVIGASGF